MGLKHFEKAAAASESVQPLYEDSRYIPQLEVRRRLDERDRQVSSGYRLRASLYPSFVT